MAPEQLHDIVAMIQNHPNHGHQKIECRCGWVGTRIEHEEVHFAMQRRDARAQRAGAPIANIHDLTARAIAHEIALQHPKSDDAAEALARREAGGLGLSGMPFVKAVEAAMEAWRALYSDGEHVSFPEAHDIPHADLALASRAVLLQTGDVQLATLYAVMALYGALSERTVTRA